MDLNTIHMYMDPNTYMDLHESNCMVEHMDNHCIIITFMSPAQLNQWTMRLKLDFPACIPEWTIFTPDAIHLWVGRDMSDMYRDTLHG
jgi:hypothetical protein